MIRKLFGFALIFIGVLSAYLFAVSGMRQGGDIFSPFRNISQNYPNSAFTFVLSVVSTLGGIVVSTGRFPRKITADIMLANSFVLVSTLAIVLLGINSNSYVALGFSMAILAVEIVAGVVLIILSFMEKPKAWESLIPGTLIHLVVTVLAIMTIVLGI